MDPIADMLVSIKNAYMAKKPNVVVPYSKFKSEIVKVLSKEGFVGEIKKENNTLTMNLIYKDNRPKISEIRRISKLGLRNYTKSKKIKSIRGGRGISIISTPKGVMSSKEAKSKNLGGEVICQVW